MLIHRLLYRSDSALAGPPHVVADGLEAILRASEASNRAAGLTGALMMSSDVFVQVLEGPLAALEATFERICCDLRHTRVRLLDFAAADDRAFGDWAMVGVAPVGDLGRLDPALEFAESPRLDAATAQSVMRLMRSMLPRGPARPRP